MTSTPGLRPALLAAFLAASASLVSAATYYLAPSGSDSSSRNGTSAQPWQSVNYAMGRIQGGDTLILKAGTYFPSSQQNITKGGPSSSTRTTVKGEDGQTVVLDGGNISGAFQAVLATSQNNITVRNLTLRNRSNGAGFRLTRSQNVSLFDLKATNVGMEGIWIGEGVESDWNRSPDNILVQDCTVWNASRMNAARTASGGWPAALSVTVARRVNIQGCTSYENYGEGIMFSRVRSGGASIKNCYTRDNFSMNIYIDGVLGSSGDYVEIDDNTAESTFKSGYYRDGRAATNFGVSAEAYNIGVGSQRTQYLTYNRNQARNGWRGFSVELYGGPSISDVFFGANTATGNTTAWFQGGGNISNIWRSGNTGF